MEVRMKSRELQGWMWNEALALLAQADRLHRQFYHLDSGPARDTTPAWEAPADVIETPEAVLVQVALPGVSADAVSVRLEPGAVVINAVRPSVLRKVADRTRATRIHRLEIPYGRFQRRIALPALALTLAEQHLADGCLTLLFARRAPEAARGVSP
jgi:HSP20 family protein